MKTSRYSFNHTPWSAGSGALLVVLVIALLTATVAPAMGPFLLLILGFLGGGLSSAGLGVFLGSFIKTDGTQSPDEYGVPTEKNLSSLFGVSLGVGAVVGGCFLLSVNPSLGNAVMHLMGAATLSLLFVALGSYLIVEAIKDYQQAETLAEKQLLATQGVLAGLLVAGAIAVFTIQFFSPPGWASFAVIGIGLSALLVGTAIKSRLTAIKESRNEKLASTVQSLDCTNWYGSSFSSSPSEGLASGEKPVVRFSDGASVHSKTFDDANTGQQYGVLELNEAETLDNGGPSGGAADLADVLETKKESLYNG